MDTRQYDALTDMARAVNTSPLGYNAYLAVSQARFDLMTKAADVMVPTDSGHAVLTAPGQTSVQVFVDVDLRRPDEWMVRDHRMRKNPITGHYAVRYPGPTLLADFEPKVDPSYDEVALDSPLALAHHPLEGSEDQRPLWRIIARRAVMHLAHGADFATYALSRLVDRL